MQQVEIVADDPEVMYSIQGVVGSGGTLNCEVLREHEATYGTSLLGSLAGAMAMGLTVLSAPPASGAAMPIKATPDARHSSMWVLEQAVPAFGPGSTPDEPWKGQILQIKEQLQLTLGDLARFARVERPSVYHWLSGSRPRPAKQRRIDVLENLARIWTTLGLGPMGAYLTRTTQDSPATLEQLLTENELRLDAIETHVVELARAAGPNLRPRQSLSDRLVARGFKPTSSETYRRQRAGVVRSISSSGEE